MRTTRLRVRLCDVEPTVLRVLDVPATSMLPELHLLLQASLGWTDSHLHEFRTDELCFVVPDEDELVEPHCRDETGVPLRELGPRFSYHYDLGDGWEHEVEVLGAGADEPGCRYGEGDCPPEDCGGPGGFAELRAALADPRHPQHAELTAWSAETPAFDQAATDELVRQTVGAVPESVRLMLELTADGIKLTPGGRLPRAVVRQVQQVRPGWAWSDRPAGREEDLLPLLALHEVLRQVGLLRLSNGVLAPIKAAADERQVVRRLRAWFSSDRFVEMLAGLTVLQLIRCGTASDDELSRRVLPELDQDWTVDGLPLDADTVRLEIARLSAVLRGLDLVDGDDPGWTPGPSARTLLPRVAHAASR